MMKRRPRTGIAVGLILTGLLGFGWHLWSMPREIHTGPSAAFGRLDEYERGEIDLDQLLADYIDYGLPLPREGSTLVSFQRDLWTTDGPTTVSHLGFRFRSDSRPKPKYPLLLVGPAVFSTGPSGIIQGTEIDPKDGSVIHEPEQFLAANTVKRWNSGSLQDIEINFHGQEEFEDDVNALLATGIQLHHLGDPRARTLVEESLRFDVDQSCCWISDFAQPAGWTARQILAESAWRTWMILWNRGAHPPQVIRDRLTRVLPELPTSRRTKALRILSRIDPDLADEVSGPTLRSAVIDFALRGGAWEKLMKRVESDPDAFDVLISLTQDLRLVPSDTATEYHLPTFEERIYGRSWPGGPGRLVSISDFAAYLLESRSGHIVIHTGDLNRPEGLANSTARARLWEEVSATGDPAAALRDRWFLAGPDRQRRIHLPALELHASLDFDELLRELPARFDVTVATDLDALTASARVANNMEIRLRRAQGLKVDTRRVLRRTGRLLAGLCDACPSANTEIKAVLLRLAMQHNPPGTEGGWDQLVDDARKQLAISHHRPEGPFACSSQAWAASLPPPGNADDLWETLGKASRRAPPGLAVEQIFHACPPEASLWRPRLRYLIAMLDDDRWRLTSDEPWRYEGAAMPEFTERRVGDFAAMRLARDFDLPWVPQPGWSGQDWERFRRRVDAAVARLSLRDHGMFMVDGLH